MDIIIAIIIGGVIGWLASLIMKTDGQQGIILNVVIGIIGSALGWWLAPKLGIAATSSLVHYGIGLGGAVLLIVILRFVGILK